VLCLIFVGGPVFLASLGTRFNANSLHYGGRACFASIRHHSFNVLARRGCLCLANANPNTPGLALSEDVRRLDVKPRYRKLEGSKSQG